MKAWNYISGWANFALPSNIQKRLYKFVLRKAIGQFLQNELDLEHFDIALLNGSVELRDLDLNLLFINKLLLDTPFVLEKGRVSSISVSIPWAKLLSGDISIRIQGLHLTLRPVKYKPRETKDELSRANSEEHLMSSSLHFADDFLRTEIEKEQARELHKSIQESFHEDSRDGEKEDEESDTDMDTEGLQVLTRVIDKMMSRVKVDVIDTLIRISHKSAVQLTEPSNTSSHYRSSSTAEEYWLDLCIPRISYFDETPEFNDVQQNQYHYTSPLMESSILTNEIIKIITIASPEIWLKSSVLTDTSGVNFTGNEIVPNDTVDYDDDEFDGGQVKSNVSILEHTEFFEADQGTSSLFQTLRQVDDNTSSSHLSGSITPKACDEEPANKPYEALLFTTMDEKNWIRLKLRPSIDAASFMSIKQIDIITAHVRAIIAPQQVAFFLDLLDTISSFEIPKPSSNAPHPAPVRNAAAEKPTKNVSDGIDILLQDLDSLQPTASTLPDIHHHDSIPIYSEIPLNTTQDIPSPVPSTASKSANCKIKLQMALAEVFILAEDNTVKDWSKPEKDTGHIRFAIQQLIARVQQFSDTSSTQGGRQYYPKQQQQQSHPSVSSPLAITEIRIANVCLDEWIKRPPQAEPMQKQSVPRSQTQYDTYNAILQLDNRIKHDYDSNIHFPHYDPTNNMNNQKQPNSPSSHMSDTGLRIRLERRRVQNSDQTTESQTFEEEINVDIPALKLLIDPRIVDRFDSYINVCKLRADDTNGRRKSSTLSQQPPTAHKPSNTAQNHGAVGPSLFDDLQNEKTVQKRKLKVKFAYIRVILFIPDMSQASTREEFNDHFHSNQLSIDIKKLVGTFASTTCMNDDDDILGLENNSKRFRMNNDLSSSRKPNKINLELDYINVFMQLKDDKLTKCWFTAKTIDDDDHVFSQGSISPTIEILIQNPVTNATMNAPSFNSPRTGIFGSGSDIPETLFNYLNRNESFTEEQKLYLPMDEQCESAMIFNQRTIETSMFVLNCHFPQADMNLTKEIWDKVQLIQNDILLWQPRFLILQQKQQTQQQYSHDNDEQQEVERDDDCSTAPSVNYHHFLSEIKSTASYFPDGHYDRAPSVRSSSYGQQQEHLPQYPSSADQHQPAKHTLLSIVAVMGNGVWRLRTSAEHTYLFEFSEFRYFAAIKHLNENENITTLDIEDFEVRDVSDPRREDGVLLLYKTLPKYIHPKRNTSMISLISRLNNFTESNTIKKITSVVVCNICWQTTMNVDFINELVEFQKAPDDLVFIDPPTQYIKVFAHVLDVSMDYEPIYSPTRAVVVLDGIEVITNILAGQPTIEVKAYLQSSELLLIDNKHELSPARVREQLDGKTSDARKYWCTLGFIRTLAIQNIELCVKIKLDEHVRAPQIDVALISTDVCIDTSADSFQTLLNLITFVSNKGDETIPAAMLAAKAAAGNSNTKAKQPTHQKKRIEETAKIFKMNPALERENMLASIDESAFKSIPTKISPPTLIDLPEMEEFSFVEEFYDSSQNNTPLVASSSKPIKPPIKPRRRMQQRQQTQRRKKLSEDNIRMLVPEEDLMSGMVEGPTSRTLPDQLPITSFFMIEDYFGVEKKVTPVSTDTIVDLAKAKLSLRVSDVNIVWKLYDGYDWDYVRSDIAAKERIRKQEEQKQQIPKLSSSPSHHQTGFESAFTATTTSRSANTNDRDKSKTETSMEIKLSNVSAVYDVMPENGDVASYFHLRIKDVDILDNIMTSDWKKFLGYMRSRTQQREVDDCMVDVELTSLRPVEGDPQEEFRLKAKLLPIRMYVDQDALVFLQTFFLFEKELLRSTAAANQSIIDGEDEDDDEDREESPILTSDLDYDSIDRSMRSTPGAFFQHVDIYPITIKVDYKPKVFKLGSLKEGQMLELMNLFRLDGSELSLSRVKLTGIKGFDQLMERLGQEWLPHILNTQKIRMVSGVSPVRSLVNLGSGMADLVLLPIQQYRKDGRLLKGIQRGTSSFARATAIEAIKLGSRVASGTQVVLEHADGFFSSSADGTKELSTAQLRQLVQDQSFVYTDVNGVEISLHDEDIYPTSPSSTDRHQASTSNSAFKTNNRRSYSSDLSDGLQFAYHNISKNLESAAQTIFAVPTTSPSTNTAADAEIRGRRDSASSDQFNYIDDADYYDGRQQGDKDNVHRKNKKNAKTVIRAVPVAVIKPMIGLTSAFQSILTGLRSSIDPVMRLQSEDKYKKAR